MVFSFCHQCVIRMKTVPPDGNFFGGTRTDVKTIVLDFDHFSVGHVPIDRGAGRDCTGGGMTTLGRRRIGIAAGPRSRADVMLAG